MYKREAVLTFGIILLILASLSFSSVGAQSITIAKDTAVPRICPGSTLLLQSTVLSSSAGSFSLSQEGEAARFSISVPTGFTLSAGGSKTIFSYITPPSSTSPGTYRLKLLARSGSSSASAEYNIIIEDCRASSLSLEQSSRSTCPGEVTSYKATLRNIGRFSEDYSLNLEGQAKSFSTLSDTSVHLAPGQEKDIYVFITPPFDVSGVFDFTLASRSSAGATSAQARVNVLPCYNYALESEKAAYELCEAEKISIPLSLENKGSVANSYRLGASGASFASLDRNAISLAPGTSGVVELLVSPSFGVQGDFPVNVNIEGTLGREKKTIPLNIKVNKCYDASLDISPEQLSLCNTFTSRQNVILKNNGKFSSRFTLSVSGASFASLDREAADLTAGESEIATLILVPGEGTPAGNYDVVVKATDPVSKITTSDTLRVTTITKEQCFLPSILLSQKVVEVAKDSAAAVTFTVENKGRENAEYVLDLSGNALQFSQINPSTIQVVPGESESVFVHIAPTLATAEGNYRITVTARLRESQVYASETLDIKVLSQGALPTTGGAVRKTGGFVDSLREFLKRIFRVEAKSTGNNTSASVERQVKEDTEELEGQEQEENQTRQAKKSFSEILREFFTFKPQEKNETSSEGRAEQGEQGEEKSEEERSNEGVSGRVITINITDDDEEEEQEERRKVEGNVSSGGLTGEATKQFVSQYAYHLLAALLLIILIILVATGAWKRVVEFFVEEENGKRKANKKGRR